MEVCWHAGGWAWGVFSVHSSWLSGCWLAVAIAGGLAGLGRAGAQVETRADVVRSVRALLVCLSNFVCLSSVRVAQH